MRKKLSGLLLLGFMAALPAGSNGQTAMKQPELLTGAGLMINLNGFLSKKGIQLDKPWVVFSDRESGAFRLGEKYYVTEENETKLHLFRASACRNRTLVGARDMGWRKKSELLVNLEAEFNPGGLLHRKCLAMIPAGTLEKIRKSDIGAEIPLFRSPEEQKQSGTVTPCLIFCVYKSEKNRYLLGRNSTIDPERPFAGQVIGWVDCDRVFEYDNRICFEPDPEVSAVAFRKCHPASAARVFADGNGLASYLQGDTTVKAVWTEPDYLFFRDPKYRNSDPGTGKNEDIAEKDYDTTLREKLCTLGGNPAALYRSRILTGSRLPGHIFRFPLVREESRPQNAFVTGIPEWPGCGTGSRPTLCETLRKNKSQVTVYFILDHSVDRNRLAYVIGQIEQEFSGFQKTYGVCFFPRLRKGTYRIAAEKGNARDSRSNYRQVRDFILTYAPPAALELQGDNLLNAMQEVLDEETLDARHTNILVMVNNRPAGMPHPGNAALLDTLRDGIARKNTYLLTFDYSGDLDLVREIREISSSAARQYAEKYRLDSGRISFEKTELGFELLQAPLLSIIGRPDPDRLAAEEMQQFLQAGYARIVSTLEQAIGAICASESDPAGSSSTAIDPLQGALERSPSAGRYSSPVPAIRTGWSMMKEGFPGDNNPGNTWKAVVLMTGPELRALESGMEKALGSVDNENFSLSAYELMIALFNRFTGDSLRTAALLDRTPAEIVQDLPGASFGYGTEDAIKQFPLRNLLENTPEIRGFFEEYRQKIKISSGRIRELLEGDRMRFCINEEVAGEKGVPVDREVCYYWVPADMLP